MLTIAIVEQRIPSGIGFRYDASFGTPPELDGDPVIAASRAVQSSRDIEILLEVDRQAPEIEAQLLAWLSVRKLAEGLPAADALPFAARAVAIDGKSANLRHTLGMILLSVGDVHSARREWKIATSHAQSSGSAAVRSLAKEMLRRTSTGADVGGGDRLDAERLPLRILAAEKTRADNGPLAAMFRDGLTRAEVITALNRAVDEDPENSYVHLTRGRFFAFYGMTDDSIHDLRLAVNLARENGNTVVLAEARRMLADTRDPGKDISRP